MQQAFINLPNIFNFILVEFQNNIPKYFDPTVQYFLNFTSQNNYHRPYIWVFLVLVIVWENESLKIIQ